jgi:beta-galactosidase
VGRHRAPRRDRLAAIVSQSGALDLFLQPKDAYYQNQSHWTEKPMVHILPHWNHPGRR